MHPIIRNILAVIFGWFTGSVINMSLIQLGNKLFPIPGIDPNDMTALAEVIPTLNAQYFIFPFLAHALGTLTGAIVAGLIAFNHKIKFALTVGGLFLLGGIMVNYMLPGPTWFAIADIVLAYIPMAWIGGKIAIRKSKTKN
ncbi:hypothetical protein KO494_01910 [Lacinutrix sp. C3R15]|uniref:hypothetical protein n=1 Tax=Flavobacteriaceae TaxID=49546 RepID=UPI001C0A4BB4|nr:MULTISPECIES: hypothetical protein [Flavobacteriaceae]MBU2938285.1 hypothetical protein [Lacinutrix sp. C3R15]MDO6621599.1 hypothetical protein [Oceanihabitans sp. 1_MG-2023]